MKQFSRFFTLGIAMLCLLGFSYAQNTLMTKAQVLGLETNSVNILPENSMQNASRDALLVEGFDVDFPPAGWTIETFNTNYTWIQSNPTDNNFNTIDPTSLYSALVPWVAEDQDEWFYTPEVDAAGETPLVVNFYAGVSGPWLSGATLRCLVSTDGGTSWTLLWDAIDEIDPAADWAWNYVSINLDTYASTPFMIAWQYVGNDGDLAGIDGVEIKSGADYIYTTDFEEWTAGDFLVLNDVSGFWDTWSSNPGSSEDAHVVAEQSSSPSNAVEMEGSSDIVFKMGDKTSGKYQFDVKYWIESGYGGYINLQHFQAPGIEWAVEVYFGASTGSDNGYMYAGDPSEIPFTFTHEQWMLLTFVVDIDNDWAEFYIDDVMIAEWQFSLQAQGDPGTLQLGGANLYAGAPTGETPHYYFDDIAYSVLAQGIASPIIGVTPTSFLSVLEEGETSNETVTVSNSGEMDLEFEVVINYPGTGKSLDIEAAGTHSPKTNYVIEKDPTNNGIAPAPSSRDDVTLHYDSENEGGAIGTTSGDYEWRVAAMFPAAYVQPYIGLEITSIDVFINDPGTAYKAQIYGMGSYNTPGPGALMVEQAFSATPFGWNTITLNEPFFIDGQDIWVGYWVSSTAGSYTPGCDPGPADDNGDWMASGPGWGHLSDNPDLDYNWNIRAYASGTPLVQWLSSDVMSGILAQGESLDAELTLNTAGLSPAQTYIANMNIRNNDPADELVVVDVTLAVITGVNENNETEYVVVYPNPAADYITVGSNGELQHIRIVNTVGQLVYDQPMNNAKAQIDISHLSNGVYFVQIETKYGTTTQKVVVE